MNLIVVAPGYSEKCQWPLLAESCARNRIPLSVYGQGKNWPGFRDGKIIGLAEHLRKLNAEYVLVTDAYDAFVTPAIKYTLGVFLEFGAKIAIAGEKACYPKPELVSRYPVGYGPYQYVNSGGFMGKWADLLNALTALAAMNIEDDQECWTEYYLDSRPGEIEIDNDCEIFQTMANAREDLTIHHGPKDTYVVNDTSGMCPAVLHFNGRAGGMDDWYKLLYEEAV